MPSAPYVSRVNQIDAAQLDEEIYKVLKNQVNEITKHQPVGKVDAWLPEIHALLKLLVWNYSLRRGKSTFGQELLNLHYSNIDKKRSVLYLILTILPGYLRDKLADHRFASDNELLRKFKFTVDLVANLVKLLELANVLMFLHRGSQPRVIEKLLGISSSPVKTQEPRTIGYSYMTRELLWHGLMELFTLGLPMINFHYLKQTARRIFARGKRADVQRSFPVMTLSTKCACCEESPILPSHAGCEHIFCYYCLKAHFTAMNKFQCPECSTELHARDMRDYVAISAPSSKPDETR